MTTTASTATAIRKEDPWVLWILCIFTFSIYYLIWYQRINKELAELAGTTAPADGQWWSQLIPIFGWVGLAKTAKRINDAHAARGSDVRVSPVVAWLLAPMWFQSQSRYLQRRVNALSDL